MAGVNDEGFWEDARVVALNERLLDLAASTWFAPDPGLAEVAWTSKAFGPLRDEARELLTAGFGTAALQVVKDPRTCLTLPFWLDLCSQLGIDARVCVIARAPLEVADSLARRDGLPPGYGLRLFARYRACIDRFAPADTIYLRYDDLLQDAPAVLRRLAEELPLVIEDSALAAAVRQDLRHQRAAAADDLLCRADAGDVDLAALGREIEARYPTEQTLREFATRLTARGVELAEIGEEHSVALATLDQRDRDVEALSAEHRKALATLDERDADIAGLAAEHTLALATIDERDEQIRELDRRHVQLVQALQERTAELDWIKRRLDTISKIPGAKLLISKLRKHAQG
jgi:hypothetical protein